MIVLDTNVVSELMRLEPSTVVLRWASTHAAETFFVTAITQAEILYGIGLLPGGKRRTAIATAAEAMFLDDFRGRILPFDSEAAHIYADIARDRRVAGRPIAQFDAQIAAIARSHRAPLATRNVADFEGCGVQIVDPWK